MDTEHPLWQEFRKWFASIGFDADCLDGSPLGHWVEGHFKAFKAGAKIGAQKAIERMVAERKQLEETHEF